MRKNSLTKLITDTPGQWRFASEANQDARVLTLEEKS